VGKKKLAHNQIRATVRKEEDEMTSIAVNETTFVADDFRGPRQGKGSAFHRPYAAAAKAIAAMLPSLSASDCGIGRRPSVYLNSDPTKGFSMIHGRPAFT
jgi:hypothetical protein